VSRDLLRRAAAKLREHAEGFERSPWKVNWGDHGYPQRVTNDRATVIAETFEGKDSSSPVRHPAMTPEYIALMHPPVALALAHWLEVAAVWPEEHLRAHPSTAVARAILREPA
jgi:hypothetical protein